MIIADSGWFSLEEIFFFSLVGAKIKMLSYQSSDESFLLGKGEYYQMSLRPASTWPIRTDYRKQLNLLQKVVISMNKNYIWKFLLATADQTFLKFSSNI